MSKILWPLVRNVIRENKVSNTYGHFPERTKGVHWGWDFYAKSGTPCFAISDGKIAMVYGNSTDKDNFGLVAVLEFLHEDKVLYAAYCHLSVVIVRVGDSIKAGDQIGTTGNSGNAFNMKGAKEHLHFEIRTSRRPPAGGAYRLSPLLVFKKCPLHYEIVEP